MNYGFWKELPQPFFVLAPMADVTDLPFRRIVAQCGRPDVWYTEFVAAAGLASRGREKLLPLLRFEPSEQPIVAQFFGADPEQMFQAAQLARELGFAGVDINMGCPDRKVMKQGAGIGLCKDPARARAIIAAAKEGAGDLPVSVKTRLGLSSVDLEGWIRPLLEEHIPTLIIHGRTAKELSQVPAHWDLIANVVAMAKEYQTLVVGNGDVMSRAEGEARAQESGADGVMVGRGIFHNPWLFATDPDRPRTPRERIILLQAHADAFEEIWGARARNFDTLKRFFKIYISGWDGAKEVRTQYMEAKTFDDVRAITRSALLQFSA
ncbi:MAG: tRNA-dihydrouridine synthase [Patescibacteria group bacterium]